MTPPPPKALTIAGSDSGGGAGIQADLKTFFAHGVHGSTVVTALTAQNTLGVTAVHPAPPDFVAAQFRAVMTDIGAAAAKTGMLANEPVIRAVVASLAEFPIPNLVVDPVMVATSGSLLLERGAVESLRRDLFPLALLVTPNLPEAAALTGIAIPDESAMREAARAILAMGPRAVLIKGGHFAGHDRASSDRATSDRSDDLFLDSSGFEIFSVPRVDSPNTHGSGCTLSAAITAHLALGRDLRPAIALAKEYVTGAILHSRPIGSGPGPLNHAWRRLPPYQPQLHP